MTARTEWAYPEATPEQLAEAERLEERARGSRRASADSFERSDTDGFLSQWASDTMAREYESQAAILRQGGYSAFRALFTLEGELVAAKLISGRYGLVWGILESDDPRSEIVQWVNRPKRAKTLAAKGYREGWVLAPAWSKLEGESRLSVSPRTFRKDGGFSRDVIIVETGEDEEEL